MNAVEAVRQFVAPLLPGYAVQAWRWTDDTNPAKPRRFAVVKPAGGARAELVRRPQLTLTLIGMQGGDFIVINDDANKVIEAMRSSSGALVSMQPSEPVPMGTANGRPVLEIAISAITH